jgi:hypothetical protein
MNTSGQQTPVDFAFDQLASKNLLGIFTYEQHTEFMELFKQAKEMEKEKQKYFFDCGRQYQLTGEGTFNEVYNETYGEK